jgi:hypothetical protein
MSSLDLLTMNPLPITPRLPIKNRIFISRQHLLFRRHRMLPSLERLGRKALSRQR